MGTSRDISEEVNGPREESSEEMSNLAARILRSEPVEGQDAIDIDVYNELLADAKRLAGSVLSQDETPQS